MKVKTNDIEKLLINHNIRYFKGKDNLGKDIDIFNIPYRGIKDPNNHIFIYLSVEPNYDIVSISLLEKANKEKNITTIKDRLLDINADVSFGSLSMRNNSDSIEFVITQKLSNFSYNEYEYCIIQCINIFEKLKEESLI